MDCTEAQDIILHYNPKVLRETKDGKQKGVDAVKHILRCTKCLVFLSKHTEELYLLQKTVKESETDTATI